MSKQYTIINNKHIQDKRLSFTAKGLLTYLYIFQHDGVFRIEDLPLSTIDTLEEIESALDELFEFGYLGSDLDERST